MGNRYGKLVVTKRVDDHVSQSGRHYAKVHCVCDCGNEIDVLAQSLTSGGQKSCGCQKNEVARETCLERNTRHGGAHRVGGKRDRLYQRWVGMKNRCYNENDHSYKRYGARGITVCDEWKNDYPAFKQWMLDNGYDINAPRGKCTIDRIDPNKGYSPENCRIVDVSVQGDNRRNVIHVEHNGETHNILQWSKITGISEYVLRKRYHKGDRGDKLFRPLDKPRKSKTYQHQS